MGPQAPTQLETANEAKGQGLSLQRMAGQGLIQKQQQQENDLKLQAQQEDQNDQSTIQGAFGDPANLKPDGTLDYDKVRAAVSPKVRVRNLQALDKDHLDLVRGTLQMDADKRAKLLAQNQSISNELMGVLQAPADQKQASWAGSRQRLIQLGDIDPNDQEFSETVPDDQTVKSLLGKHGYAAQVQSLATAQAEEERKKDVAKRAEAQAAKEQALADAKDAQQKIEDAARDHLKVTDQASHDEWLAGLDINTAKRMPKKFDPNTTPQVVQNMALTAEQRAQNIDKDIQAKASAQRAAVAGGKAGLAAAATDPTGTDESRKAAADALKLLEKSNVRESAATAASMQKYDRSELTADRNRHDTLQEKEQDKWRQAGIFDDAANTAIGARVVDPRSTTNATFVQSAETQKRYKAQADSFRNEAMGLQKSAKQIRAQHQWGEFAPGKQQTEQQQETPAQPAAQPNSSTGIAPQKTAPNTNGIRYKGGVPYKFDSKSNQWLPQPKTP